MAKKKKKARPEKALHSSAPETANVSSSGTADQSDSSVKGRSTPAGSIDSELGKKEPVKAPSPPKTHGVKYSTCIAGMCLTLVLGIYIGTLLPGLIGPGNNSPVSPGPVAPMESNPPQDSGLKASIAEMEKRAAANLDSAPEWINLGNLYFDGHMPEKAISAYEHALKLAPKNADVLTDLGIMYREVGQYEKAVECFRKAIALEPDHQNAMYNEGVVLSTDLHKKEEAALAWQRLLELNPHAKAPNGTPLSEMIKQLR